MLASVFPYRNRSDYPAVSAPLWAGPVGSERPISVNIIIIIKRYPIGMKICTHIHWYLDYKTVKFQLNRSTDKNFTAILSLNRPPLGPSPENRNWAKIIQMCLSDSWVTQKWSRNEPEVISKWFKRFYTVLPIFVFGGGARRGPWKKFVVQNFE